MDYAGRDDLSDCLDHLLETAGNRALMTQPLKDTLVDHASGNYRVLMNLCDELLAVAADRDIAKLDEKLYVEAFAPPQKSKQNGRRKHA